MKEIRTAALSRHQAPAFVMLAGLELMQLCKLQPLARVLFLELLAMADFATGRVVTSYAVLEALLDFDQAPCAHAADKPTQRRVRTALEQLLELRLVRLDRIKNEKDKGLFLKVQPRKGISAPEGMSDRLSDRPRNAEKPATARVPANRGGDERQTERQGVQEGITTPLSPLPVHIGQVAVALNPGPPQGARHQRGCAAHAPRSLAVGAAGSRRGEASRALNTALDLEGGGARSAQAGSKRQWCAPGRMQRMARFLDGVQACPLPAAEKRAIGRLNASPHGRCHKLRQWVKVCRSRRRPAFRPGHG